VVPDTHDPSGEAGAATACTSTRQVCLWSNRNRPDIQDPGLLPQTSSELLAHESAHLLFPHGGPPDFDGWRAAIDADRPNHYGYRYVDDAIECYAVDQHEREDWANAVAMLHESVRDDEAHLDELRVGSQGFRDSYPNRARIIDRLLAASGEGATSPTVEH
jgi:hypothetical protein